MNDVLCKAAAIELAHKTQFSMDSENTLRLLQIVAVLDTRGVVSDDSYILI